MIDLEGISASCIRVESTNERRGLQRDSCHGFDVHVAGIEVNLAPREAGCGVAEDSRRQMFRHEL